MADYDFLIALVIEIYFLLKTGRDGRIDSRKTSPARVRTKVYSKIDRQPIDRPNHEAH